MVGDITKRFGKEVKRRREEAGLTLKALSERSGISPTHLPVIEAGKKSTSIEHAGDIARALGAPLGEMFGLGSIPSSTMEAARLFDDLDAGAKAAVLGLLRAMGKPRDGGL